MRSVNPGKLDRRACEESYRLSTYTLFPHYAQVDPVGLAKSGFYFTGHRDEVVCFSCCMKVGDWFYYHDVHSDKWHKGNCQFKKGRNCGNIPIDSTHFPLPTRSNEPSCQIDSIIQYPTPVNPQMENKDTRLGPDFIRYAPSVLLNLHRTVDRSPRVIIPTHPRHVVPREAYPVAPSNQQPEIVNSAVESRRGRSEISGSSRSELIKESAETEQHHKLAVKSQRGTQQVMRHECREVFRFCSFLNFPPDAPVSPTLLAKDGFFYAQDQVRCFSCGYTIENWKNGVVQLKRCHEPNCSFKNGEECGNISVALSPANSQCELSTSL